MKKYQYPITQKNNQKLYYIPTQCAKTGKNSTMKHMGRTGGKINNYQLTHKGKNQHS